MQPLGGGRIEAARFHGRCQRGPPRRRRHDGHQRTGSAARPAAPALTPTSSTTSPTENCPGWAAVVGPGTRSVTAGYVACECGPAAHDMLQILCGGSAASVMRSNLKGRNVFGRPGEIAHTDEWTLRLDRCAAPLSDVLFQLPLKFFSFEEPCGLEC
jgi:hypothetical protein